MRHDQNWKFDEKNLMRERENKDGKIKKQPGVKSPYKMYSMKSCTET